jgi:hypothetical protein
MAQTVIKTDDIDGTANAETIEFGIEGVTYTIDLSESNAAALLEALEPFISAGQKVSGRGKPKARQNGSNGAAPVDPSAVRAWAKVEGIEISERGRIAKGVFDAYLEAH